MARVRETADNSGCAVASSEVIAAVEGEVARVESVSKAAVSVTSGRAMKMASMV